MLGIVWLSCATAVTGLATCLSEPQCVWRMLWYAKLLHLTLLRCIAVVSVPATPPVLAAS